MINKILEIIEAEPSLEEIRFRNILLEWYNQKGEKIEDERIMWV